MRDNGSTLGAASHTLVHAKGRHDVGLCMFLVRSRRFAIRSSYLRRTFTLPRPESIVMSIV